MNDQLNDFYEAAAGKQQDVVSRMKRKRMKSLKVYSKKPDQEKNDQNTNYVSRKFIFEMKRDIQKDHEEGKRAGFLAAYKSMLKTSEDSKKKQKRGTKEYDIDCKTLWDEESDEEDGAV